MNPVRICGLGAVSPAGWGLGALREALDGNQAPAPSRVEGPGPFQARLVPRPDPRPAILNHPRLRRSSPISQYAAAAALEALAEPPCKIEELGILFSTMCGSVRYTRRFYAETLEDPSTASPILFPETVFNAPASHIAAALEARVPTYSLVGDSSVFLQALALGAQWVSSGFVKASLVVAGEECDWSVLEGWRLFSRHTVMAEGAAAVCLTQAPTQERGVALHSVHEPSLFAVLGSPLEATSRLAGEMEPAHQGEWLYDSRSGLPQADKVENTVWPSWPGPRVSPKTILGEAMTAATGWQCVAAIDQLARSPAGQGGSARIVSVGCNHQAMAARFVTIPEDSGRSG